MKGSEEDFKNPAHKPQAKYPQQQENDPRRLKR